MAGGKKFRFLEHTADVMFEAFGKSFGEALENAALALFETIADTRKIKPKTRIALEEKAEKLEDLASFVLSDLVAESDARELFFKKIAAKKFVKKDGNYFIRVVAAGEPYSVENGRTHVKAVTRHETQVEEKDGKWRIRILLDI